MITGALFKEELKGYLTDKKERSYESKGEKFGKYSKWVNTGVKGKSNIWCFSSTSKRK